MIAPENTYFPYGIHLLGMIMVIKRISRVTYICSFDIFSDAVFKTDTSLKRTPRVVSRPFITPFSWLSIRGIPC